MNQKQQQEEFCQQHGLQIIMLDLDRSIPLESRLMCYDCFLKRGQAHTISIENVKQEISRKKTIINNIINVYSQKSKAILNQKFDQFQEIFKAKKALQNHFENWKNDMNSFQYKEYPNLVSQIPDLYENMTEQQLSEQIKIAINTIDKQYEKLIKNKIQDLIEHLQQLYQKFEKNEILLSTQIAQTQIQKDVTQQHFQQEEISEKIQLIQKIENSGSNNLAFAFNIKKTMLVSSCGDQIKIWNIANSSLEKNPLILKGHNNNIPSIVISKISNWFASGSEDKSIITWKLQNEKWEQSCKYEKHKGQIQQLLLSNQENELISCCDQGEIIIWKVNQNNNTLNFQYSLENGHVQGKPVYGICLNSSEELLLSFGEDSMLILWKQYDEKWQNRTKFKLFNKVKESNYVSSKVCFISKDEFILTPRLDGLMKMFYISSQEQIEELSSYTIELHQNQWDQGYCHPIFIKEKNILLLRHNNYIFLLERTQQGNFIMFHTIDCQGYDNSVSITADGELLVKWDDQPKTIELYKIKYSF